MMTAITGDYFDELLQTGLSANTSQDSATYPIGADFASLWAAAQSTLLSPMTGELPGDVTNPYTDYAPPNAPETSEYTDAYLPSDDNYDAWLASSMTTPGLAESESMQSWLSFDHDEMMSDLQFQTMFENSADAYTPPEYPIVDSAARLVPEYLADEENVALPTLATAQAAQNALDEHSGLEAYGMDDTYYYSESSTDWTWLATYDPESYADESTEVPYIDPYSYFEYAPDWSESDLGDDSVFSATNAAEGDGSNVDNAKEDESPKLPELDFSEFEPQLVSRQFSGDLKNFAPPDPATLVSQKDISHSDADTFPFGEVTADSNATYEANVVSSLTTDPDGNWVFTESLTSTYLVATSIPVPDGGTRYVTQQGSYNFTFIARLTVAGVAYSIGISSTDAVLDDYSHASAATSDDGAESVSSAEMRFSNRSTFYASRVATPMFDVTGMVVYVYVDNGGFTDAWSFLAAGNEQSDLSEGDVTDGNGREEHSQSGFQITMRGSTSFDFSYSTSEDASGWKLVAGGTTLISSESGTASFWGSGWTESIESEGSLADDDGEETTASSSYSFSTTENYSSSLTVMMSTSMSLGGQIETTGSASGFDRADGNSEFTASGDQRKQVRHISDGSEETLDKKSSYLLNEKSSYDLSIDFSVGLAANGSTSVAAIRAASVSGSGDALYEGDRDYWLVITEGDLPTGDGSIDSTNDGYKYSVHDNYAFSLTQTPRTIVSPTGEVERMTTSDVSSEFGVGGNASFEVWQHDFVNKVDGAHTESSYFDFTLFTSEAFGTGGDFDGASGASGSGSHAGNSFGFSLAFGESSSDSESGGDYAAGDGSYTNQSSSFDFSVGQWSHSSFHESTASAAASPSPTSDIWLGAPGSSSSAGAGGHLSLAMSYTYDFGELRDGASSHDYVNFVVEFGDEQGAGFGQQTIETADGPESEGNSWSAASGYSTISFTIHLDSDESTADGDLTAGDGSESASGFSYTVDVFDASNYNLSDVSAWETDVGGDTQYSRDFHSSMSASGSSMFEVTLYFDEEIEHPGETLSTHLLLHSLIQDGFEFHSSRDEVMPLGGTNSITGHTDYDATSSRETSIVGNGGFSEDHAAGDYAAGDGWLRSAQGGYLIDIGDQGGFESHYHTSLVPSPTGAAVIESGTSQRTADSDSHNQIHFLGETDYKIRRPLPNLVDNATHTKFDIQTDNRRESHSYDDGLALADGAWQHSSESSTEWTSKGQYDTSSDYHYLTIHHDGDFLAGNGVETRNWGHAFNMTRITYDLGSHIESTNAVDPATGEPVSTWSSGGHDNLSNHSLSQNTWHQRIHAIFFSPETGPWWEMEESDSDQSWDTTDTSESAWADDAEPTLQWKNEVTWHDNSDWKRSGTYYATPDAQSYHYTEHLTESGNADTSNPNSPNFSFPNIHNFAAAAGLRPRQNPANDPAASPADSPNPNAMSPQDPNAAEPTFTPDDVTPVESENSGPTPYSNMESSPNTHLGGFRSVVFANLFAVLTHPQQERSWIFEYIIEPLSWPDPSDFLGPLGTLGKAAKIPQKIVGDLLSETAERAAAELAERSAKELAELAPKVTANFTTTQLEKKWKHAVDFGITTTKRNPTTLAEYQAAITRHLNDQDTVVKGTYGWVENSVVHFNPKTNIAVVLDNAGKYITGWKLKPGTTQFEKFIKDGFLK